MTVLSTDRSDQISAPKSAQAHQARAILLALFTMVLIGSQLLQHWRGSSGLSGDGDVLRQVAYLGIFIITLACLRPDNDLRSFSAIPAGYGLLFAYCALSLTWSIDPSIAARRLGFSAIVAITIFLAVHTLGANRAIIALRQILALTLVANLLAVLTLPAAVHLAGEGGNPALVGNWRGIMLQKNFAGAACALTILFFAFGPPFKSRSYRFAVIAVAVVFLWQTQSRTSAALLLPALLVGALYLKLGHKLRLWLAPVLLLSLIAAIGLPTDWLSQPELLTGRNLIWSTLWQYASEHPLTGAGFGSFWNIGPASPVYSLSASWIASQGHGHSGYLDTLVQLGYPGLLITIVVTLLLPARQLLVGGTARSPSGALFLAILVFAAGHNITETSLLERDAIVWVFLIFAAAGIRQLMREQP